MSGRLSGTAAGRLSGTAAGRLSGTVEHTVAPGDLDIGQMLVVIAGEVGGALQVDGDEVQPVARGRILRRDDGRFFIDTALFGEDDLLDACAAAWSA